MYKYKKKFYGKIDFNIFVKMSGYHYILTTRRLLNPASRDVVKPLANAMHEAIHYYPGFIYAKSFWSNDRGKMFTITKWNTYDHWMNWRNSKERKMLLKKYYHEAIIIEEDYIDKFEQPEIIIGGEPPKDIEDTK